MSSSEPVIPAIVGETDAVGKIQEEVTVVAACAESAASAAEPIQLEEPAGKTKKDQDAELDNVIIREEDPGDFKGYEDKTNYDVYNVKREGYFFENEVKINGETIFTIPMEQQLEQESEVPKRKSRWGDRPQRRKKAPVNLLFNPFQGLTKGNGMLQITADGYKPGDTFKAVEDEEEKVSRWGPEFEKTFHPPLLNFIPQGITDDELEYLIRLYRLDEIHYKSVNRTNNILDDQDCRSPSPPPIYNESGKRINLREVRDNEAIIKEKSNIIEEAMRINPTFIPPHDFKIQKKQKKIYLPEQNAELLKQKVIGLKGATHKKLEQETGCKISIKGKGASHGLKRIDNDVNEKLHILIQAAGDEEIEKAAAMIDEILRGEEQEEPAAAANNQVALINEIIGREFCSKCHQTGHRSWECVTKTTFNKVEVKCDICGDKGHVTSDCKFKREHTARQAQHKHDRQAHGDMNQKFEQFINEVEGSQNLITKFGRQNDPPPRPAITATSFLTDNVVIDPNMLMIKHGDSLPSGFQGIPSSSAPPSGPSNPNTFSSGSNFDFPINRSRAFDTFNTDRPPQNEGRHSHSNNNNNNNHHSQRSNNHHNNDNNSHHTHHSQQPSHQIQNQPAQHHNPHLPPILAPALLPQVVPPPMQMPPMGFGAPPQFYGAPNPYGYFPQPPPMGYFPGYGMPPMNPYYSMPQQQMFQPMQQAFNPQQSAAAAPVIPVQPQLPPSPPG